MKRWMLIILFILLIPLSTYAFELIPIAQFRGVRAIILKEGVGYYYEKTRPPTEDEVKKRLEWFEQEWEKLKEKEPEFEKALSEGEKKFKEELSKRKPPTFLRDFFMSVFPLFRLIAKEGMKMAEPLAKNYFTKAPVVVEAGFVIKRFDGSSYNLKIDFHEEEWKRMPSEGIYPISSSDGRYLALMTESDFGRIRVFRIEKEKLEPIFEVVGSTPFAFSPNGEYFSYASPNRSHMLVVDKEGNPIRNIPISYKIAGKKEDIGPIRIALSESYLGIVSWIGIKRVDLKSGEEKEVRLRGGKSIVFNRTGDRIYANSVGGEVFIYDLKSLNLIKKLDPFYLRKRGVYIQYIASISPEERFIAVLYDPSSYDDKAPLETSTLLIYDLESDRVIKRVENLESITGGFGGVFLPVSFTEDWSYVLLSRKGNVVELYKIKGDYVKSGKKFCQSDSDCVCGIDKETGECAFGNKEFIDTSKQCPDFCTGIHGGFRIRCVYNLCRPVLIK